MSRHVPPGPGTLLDDRERQTGLREADAGDDARLPAADDDDRRVGPDLGRDLVAPRDGAAVGAVEVQVVEEQRRKIVADGLAREERHHLADDLGRERLRLAAGVAIREHDGQRTTANLGALLLRHAALELHRRRDPRPRLTADPRRVAGHVDQGAQQGGDAHVLEHRGDGGVVVRERRAGVGVPSVALVLHDTFLGHRGDAETAGADRGARLEVVTDVLYARADDGTHVAYRVLDADPTVEVPATS